MPTTSTGGGLKSRTARHRTSLASYDPCITIRTKSASVVAAQMTSVTGDTWTVAKVNTDLNFFDGDVGIFIRKPFPWDGKGGTTLTPH